MFCQISETVGAGEFPAHPPNSSKAEAREMRVRIPFDVMMSLDQAESDNSPLWLESGALGYGFFFQAADLNQAFGRFFHEGEQAA